MYNTIYKMKNCDISRRTVCVQSYKLVIAISCMVDIMFNIYVWILHKKRNYLYLKKQFAEGGKV
jgi:hypothetical protein